MNSQFSSVTPSWKRLSFLSSLPFFLLLQVSLISFFFYLIIQISVANPFTGESCRRMPECQGLPNGHQKGTDTRSKLIAINKGISLSNDKTQVKKNSNSEIATNFASNSNKKYNSKSTTNFAFSYSFNIQQINRNQLRVSKFQTPTQFATTNERMKS